MKISRGISKGQVLQRLGKNGANANIIGTCKFRGVVQASIFSKNRLLPHWNKVVVGKAGRGKFSVALKKIPAGGPYRLELKAGPEIVQVESFFVGDVWLLAGQSQMEGLGDMTHPAKPHPLIRNFSMARRWILATDPLHVLRESPDACHSELPSFTLEESRQYQTGARKGVGVGIFFAREMLKRSGVPQGLICTAHGGTSMTQWDPARKSEGGGSLYGSMMLSVAATGQPVAGMLWLQGEGDATPAERAHYTERMKNLVRSTRRDLKQPDLPWVMVQIGRVFDTELLVSIGQSTAVSSQTSTWNDVQEQQRLLPNVIKNLEVVSSVDLPLDDSIHIGAEGYPRLGARMARMADRLCYKNGKELGSPRLRKIHLTYSTKTSVGMFGPSMEVVFHNVSGALRAGSEPQGFTIVTKEGHVWPLCYKTTLHGSTARLHLVKPPPDGAVLFHGHGTTPICNITDDRDLPLPLFGPVSFAKEEAYLPFVTKWNVTDAIAEPSLPLGKLTCPDLKDFPSTIKTYGEDGIVNENPVWRGKSGQAYFSAQLELPEPMKLQFLMGYDGPFRLWLDGTSFFTNLKGTNPCLPDESSRTLALKAGCHRLTVAMDINLGMAWGFFLRFVRRDVTKAQVMSNTYRRPLYSV